MTQGPTSGHVLLETAQASLLHLNGGSASECVVLCLLGLCPSLLKFPSQTGQWRLESLDSRCHSGQRSARSVSSDRRSRLGLSNQHSDQSNPTGQSIHLACRSFFLFGSVKFWRWESRPAKIVRGFLQIGSQSGFSRRDRPVSGYSGFLEFIRSTSAASGARSTSSVELPTCIDANETVLMANVYRPGTGR